MHYKTFWIKPRKMCITIVTMGLYGYLLRRSYSGFVFIDCETFEIRKNISIWAFLWISTLCAIVSWWTLASALSTRSGSWPEYLNLTRSDLWSEWLWLNLTRDSIEFDLTRDYGPNPTPDLTQPVSRLNLIRSVTLDLWLVTTRDSSNADLTRPMIQIRLT